MPEVRGAAVSNDPKSTSKINGAATNSKCKPRHYRFSQPGVIPTGPLVGMAKIRQTDGAHYLTVRKVINLVNAKAFSESIGTPFNARLDITWKMSSLFTESNWATLQTNLLDHTGRYLIQQGIQPAFAWARERVHGKGPHTHIAIHLGKEPAKIKASLLEFLNEKFEFECNAVNRGLNIGCGSFGAHTKKMQAGLFIYILKGIDHGAIRYVGRDVQNIAEKLGIEDRGQQGIILLKRAGTSQSIGRSARRAYNWTEIRDLDGIAREIAQV